MARCILNIVLAALNAIAFWVLVILLALGYRGLIVIVAAVVALGLSIAFIIAAYRTCR